MKDDKPNYRSSTSLPTMEMLLEKARKAFLKEALEESGRRNTMLKLKKLEEGNWIVKAYNSLERPSLAAFHRIVAGRSMRTDRCRSISCMDGPSLYRAALMAHPTLRRRVTGTSHLLIHVFLGSDSSLRRTSHLFHH
jgi:hypothetical protein